MFRWEFATIDGREVQAGCALLLAIDSDLGGIRRAHIRIVWEFPKSQAVGKGGRASAKVGCSRPPQLVSVGNVQQKISVTNGVVIQDLRF